MAPARDASGRFVKGSGSSTASVRFTNVQEFRIGLDRFAKEVEKAGVAFVKKVAFLVLGAFVIDPLSGKPLSSSGLVHLTPVDTGRAVGNWQVTIGVPASGSLDKTFGEGGGEGVRSSAKSFASRAGILALQNLRLGQDVWITNNLAYIGVLNNGGVNRKAHHMLERSARNATRAIRSRS